ncbi:MAG TPA: hypothetical protein VFN31_00815, partial [Candidatus Saccharimonadales bacterium]|nr:hypothetical protein [Candidatus Saccharimonadales bacterium]
FAKMIKIDVNEDYQKGYSYLTTAPMGQNFDPEFNPDLTPRQMLSLGVFGGDYFNEIPKEFPSIWFSRVKLSPGGAIAELNYFKVNASQPLKEWQKNGWIYFEDPKGWFLWYCRYFLGRRIPIEDERQIKRWKAVRRHIKQLQKHCAPGDISCRPKQRQALLHWAYDSRVL